MSAKMIESYLKLYNNVYMNVYINKPEQGLLGYMYYIVFIHVISPVPDRTGKTLHFRLVCSLTVEALKKM